MLYGVNHPDVMCMIACILMEFLVIIYHFKWVQSHTVQTLMRTSVLSAESLLFAVLNRVVKSLKQSSLGYPIVFFRMGDRASSSALMSAYHHVKRTGDAIRKAGRMFGVPESILRRRLNNPEIVTQSVGHPTLFSRAERMNLQTIAGIWPD